MTDTVTGAARTARSHSEWRAYVYLAGLLVIALGVLVWLVVQRGDEKTKLPPVGSGPAAVSEAQLKALAQAVHHPVYWAGARSDVAYELTRTTDGRIYIRYLPSAESVGDKAPKFLTVGTYPTKTAYLGLKRAARRKGSFSLELDHGGLMVLNMTRPKSVYFAYPKQPYQVEVYDPSAERARALVLGGKIEPLG